MSQWNRDKREARASSISLPCMFRFLHSCKNRNQAFRKGGGTICSHLRCGILFAPKRQALPKLIWPYAENERLEQERPLLCTPGTACCKTQSVQDRILNNRSSPPLPMLLSKGGMGSFLCLMASRQSFLSSGKTWISSGSGNSC